MNEKKIHMHVNTEKITGNYQKWLIENLRDAQEGVTYLTVSLEEFEKDRDIEAFVLSVKNYLEAKK